MPIKYQPKEIEKKWQEKWKKDKIYKFKGDGSKKKYYTLVELPYTSGDLHIGHWFTFVTPDALSRFKRMNGFDVFFPHGYDTIGLPAENAAIRRGIHPRDWTLKNIETMQKQFQTMGSMIDLEDPVITCTPEYFHWNQWIFIKMFEKGIAYRGKTLSNWCPVDKTVLADEHVENGKCWRCGATVEKKEVAQWFLKITKHADELIWPENPSVDWPKPVREGQNNWIGRSEGMTISFTVILNDSEGSLANAGSSDKLRDSSATPQNDNVSIEVFTTRPETIDGATFLVLAPEHKLIQEILKPHFAKASRGKQVQDDNIKNEVKKYISLAVNKSELERKENKKKTGVFSGLYAINPVSKKKIPIWIADYVLAGYGTGAIMAVPEADERDREFAEKFELPIEKTSFKAKPEGKKQINYHIRDWSISRQRYWGTPVPMIHCPDCGIVPVPLKDLPVELPYEVDFTPTGKPPLATNEKWLKVKCPSCGGDARRDPETLDTFFDSAWYYYRYTSPDYQKAPFSTESVERLMPVDIYFGGSEHTLGHTLYARFFTKFFKDLGLIKFDEFAKKRVQHGIVLGPDGNKMSKSKGNVINPDDMVKEYGADATRLYLAFMMPYEGTAPWSTEAIQGMHRFLQRIWMLQEKIPRNKSQETNKSQILSSNDKVIMNKTIQKVGEDLEEIKANTAIAAIMEWLNHLSRKETISEEEYKTLLVLLSPFAPHITEELWQAVILEGVQRPIGSKKQDSIASLQNDKKNSIHSQPWPAVDEKALQTETIKIPVQINGKVRGVIEVASKDTSKETVVQKALEDEKIQNYLEGKKYEAIYVPGKILNFVVKE